MLDEFRSTLITWDKATSRIYSPVTANASDENGRKLVVQIVNGGQVEDLTGATLHLYWETRDKAHDGLDVFDAVDLEKGEFELSYTTGMLSNKGVLNANLVLIDTVGRVVSERFKITVTEGIDNDAIQSENSFSSLTQALIDVGPRLNDLTAQLQQTNARVDLLNRGLGETFSTLAELQTAYPTGDTKDHIVASDGHRYYWNDTTWADGGAYQAVEITDYSILPTKIDGAQIANYFNPDTVTEGKRLARSASFPAGGTVEAADATYCYTDFIPITNGDIWTIKKAGFLNTSMVFLYNSSKVVITDIKSTTSWQQPFTFTINNASAAFMRVNILINEIPKTAQMIVKGSNYPTVYSPYLSSKIDWLVLNDKSVGIDALGDDVYNKAIKDIRKLYLPRKVYAIANSHLKIFFRSVVSAPDLKSILYKSTLNDGRSKLRDGYYTRYSSAGTPTESLYIHDAKTGELIEGGTFMEVFTDPATKSNPSTVKNILCFGDSFMQAGIIPRELKSYLVTTRGWTNYNFIGRKTDYDTNHQGMGGYAIHDFVIPPAEMREGFTENPFYNPTTQALDFNYYMTNNSFTGDIDYLVLEHGVNDLLTYNRTPKQIVADLKIFIDQLHINYPNCKVLLCGLVHPSPLNDFYDAYLQSERIHPINKAYDDFAANALYSGFVTYVPVCIGFDVDYGYQFTTAAAYRNSTEQVKVLTDYLHPNEAGYCMEADQIKAAFLAII